MRKEVEKMNLKNRFIIKASIGFALGILVDLIIHTVFVLSGSSYLLAGTLSQVRFRRRRCSGFSVSSFYPAFWD